MSNKEELKKLTENVDSLNEEGLSWSGKLFFSSLVASLLGDGPAKIPMKIRGNEEHVKALMDLVTAYKELRDETKNPNATIESVMEKLNRKNELKKEFEEKTNHLWPLG